MKWVKKELSQDIVRDLSSRYGIDTLTASILARRGVTAPDDVLFFLEDDPRYLHNPFLLSGMEDAVDRILQAADEGEKVMVFGDRDVDGITGTTLLYETLRGLGLDVTPRIPSGTEPYGLTEEAVKTFADSYGTLIVTVDCGITNHKEITYAAGLGVDVIVVDHHLPRDTLPEAAAIVNPKLPDSGYPFRDLAGVGVAYKVSRAIDFSRTELYKQQVCLLNVRPANDAYTVDVIKLSNMMERGRLSETLVPGMVDVTKTRLAKFLEGQQILAWDAPLMKKLLSKVLGTGVEIGLMDIRDEISREIPSVAGLSLLRLRELSRIAKYREAETGEIDVFMNLFVSFVQKKSFGPGERDGYLLSLVTLGTIADIMPLRDENRIMVKRGLDAISKNPGNGIRELVMKRDLRGKPLTSQDVSWQITPLINASGRMGKPEVSLSLFIENDPLERERLADTIIGLNEERKRLGQDSWEIAWKPANDSLARLGGKLVLVADGKIHRGITGILASKLVSTFDVPAIAVSFQGDIATGSMRSNRGIDAKVFLETFKEHLLDYGGHSRAAGFSMPKSGWDRFMEAVEAYSRAMDLSDSEAETIMIDAELPHEYLNPELVALVDKFEPFGAENEQITFCARKVKVVQLDLVGRPEPVHVKMLLECGAYKWPAVYWKASERVKRDFELGDHVDIVFRVGKNAWSGTVTPQMVIVDLEKSK